MSFFQGGLTMTPGGNIRTTKDVVSSKSRGSAPVGYEDLWNANPYENYEYRHSGWQKFLESLGFRTNYDAFRESMALNSAEYDSQVMQKAYNEKYDSPLEQARRQREAGLNPDLNGNVDSGSASPMEPDPNAPIAPENDFAQVSQFGSMVISSVQMAAGLASTGMSIVGDLAALQGQKLSNDNSKLDLAIRAMLAVTSPEDMDNFRSSDMSVQAINYMPALEELFGSRRAKKIVGTVNKVAVGLTGHDLETQMRNHQAGEWMSLFDKTSGNGYSPFTETMNIIRKELSTNLWENAKKAAKLEGSKLSNEQSYEDTLSQEGIPSVLAHNEGVESAYDVTLKGQDIQMNAMRLAMKESYNNLIQHLNKAADRGNWFASIVAILLQFAGAQYLGM